MRNVIFKRSSSLGVALMLLLSTVAPAVAQVASSPGLTALCATLGPNLTIGSTGNAVTALQQYLSERGYYQPVTGYFGTITRGNVARLQAALQVSPTSGYFGPLTRAALLPYCTGQVGTGNTIIGPTVIGIGTTGTWTVTTIANVGNAAFYILWGDTRYDANTSPLRSVAFTHSYTAAGTYAIKAFVVSPSGAVSYATATVLVSNTTSGGVTVTSPTQGQTVVQSGTLPISWSYPNAPAGTNMVLDLYTSGNSKIGTIAVTSNTTSTYNWNVPTSGTVCTLQYPNGLCGQNLSGQYYIRVSAVSGSGLETNPNVIASGNSGVFTVTQQTTAQIATSPTAGQAPLNVTFNPGTYTGYYNINFGDGSSTPLATGVTTHTYTSPGTYTASFTSDAPCLHTSPACTIAVQNFGSVTITAF